MELIPPEALLTAFPECIAIIGERIRVLVRDAVPDAIERVRPGWGVIGFDAPRRHDGGRGKPVYFAYIAPERQHIHLGFEHGHVMRDETGRLQGEGVTRRVRWLTFQPGDQPDQAIVVPLVHEARRVALLSRAERFEELMRAGSERT